MIFNNMLAVISGNLELFILKNRSDEKLQHYLDSASAAAVRCSDLTKKLLGFARTEVVGNEIKQVNEIILNLKKLIEKSLTASIKIENYLANDLWLVDISSADLEDALMNLSINARDAMSSGGTLTVETANKILDHEYVSQNLNSKLGEHVMISVSDSGTGMSLEIQEKVFEPFYSTKDKSKGTGLGLSMVYGFVQRSGGHITLDSKLGEGSTFRIYLPKAEGIDSIAEVVQREIGEKPKGAETILIVDDEPALLMLASTMLEELGYEVFSANSGQEALDSINANPEIDLLLSDIIMPGNLDGYQLAVNVAKQYPAIKILLASGFTENRDSLWKDTVDSKTVSELKNNILKKPYSYSELAIAVRSVLDE